MPSGTMVTTSNLEACGYKSFPPGVRGEYCTNALQRTVRDESCLGQFRRRNGHGNKMFFIDFYFYVFSDRYNVPPTWEAECCLYVDDNLTFTTKVYGSPDATIEQIEKLYLKIWESLGCEYDRHNNP